MQHLRKTQTTVKPLLSLASFYCDITASRNPLAVLLRSSHYGWSLISAQQALAASPHPLLPQADVHYIAAAYSPAYSISSRGFASRGIARFKQSVNRAERIAQQQKGGRKGPVRDTVDPTSNEAVATIPQESSTVQASKGPASELQVSFTTAQAKVNTMSRPDIITSDLIVPVCCNAACMLLCCWCQHLSHRQMGHCSSLFHLCCEGCIPFSIENTFKK